MDDCLMTGVKFMLAELDRCSLVRADLRSSELMGGLMLQCNLSEIQIKKSVTGSKEGDSGGSGSNLQETLTD